MSETRVIDEALIRRIEVTIGAATVSRSAVEFEWPECHRKGCQGRHGSVDQAFGIMKRKIMDEVRSELMCEVTTRPDIGEDGDTPEQVAVYTLTVLMDRYNVNKTSTYVKAAQLMVDAYPALIQALAEEEVAS